MRAGKEGRASRWWSHSLSSHCWSFQHGATSKSQSQSTPNFGDGQTNKKHLSTKSHQLAESSIGSFSTLFLLWRWFVCSRWFTLVLVTCHTITSTKETKWVNEMHSSIKSYYRYYTPQTSKGPNYLINLNQAASKKLLIRTHLVSLWLDMAL